MGNQIAVPEEYKYRAERAGFERKNAVANAAFILSHHLSDSDTDFLESDTWKNLVANAASSCLACSRELRTIACELTDNSRMSMFSFLSDWDYLEYEA